MTEKSKNWGGARKGAGRPQTPEENRVTGSISLRPELWTKVEAWAAGQGKTISSAIEKLLEETLKDQPLLQVDMPKGKQPLFKQYEGQVFPQPAYIWLDCEHERIWADYAREDAQPADVYAGKTIRWRIDETLSAQEVRSLLRKIAPLASRIIPGYSLHWNGRSMAASYTPEAEAAIAEIAAICESACQ